MDDWIIFIMGCFALLLAMAAAGILLYAIETDVRD